MFDGQGVLTLEGDHLDISFRSHDSWPSMIAIIVADRRHPLGTDAEPTAGSHRKSGVPAAV